MHGCLTCDVNDGTIAPPGGPIYVDEQWQADHEFTPLMRGYVILKPRRHVHELADLDAAEAASLGRVLASLHAAMRTSLGTERIYTCSFAETVHHLHFHIIPRNRETPALGPNLLPRVFAGEFTCSPEEAAQAVQLIRASLAG